MTIQIICAVAGTLAAAASARLLALVRAAATADASSRLRAASASAKRCRCSSPRRSRACSSAENAASLPALALASAAATASSSAKARRAAASRVGGVSSGLLSRRLRQVFHVEPHQLPDGPPPPARPRTCGCAPACATTLTEGTAPWPTASAAESNKAESGTVHMLSRHTQADSCNNCINTLFRRWTHFFSG